MSCPYRGDPSPSKLTATNGLVVFLMGLTEFDGHCQFIIEVGKGAIGIFGACIEDGLSCLLDFGFLGIRRGWPREVVVDDILRISVITLEPSAFSA